MIGPFNPELVEHYLSKLPLDERRVAIIQTMKCIQDVARILGKSNPTASEDFRQSAEVLNKASIETNGDLFSFRLDPTTLEIK